LKWFSAAATPITVGSLKTFVRAEHQVELLRWRDSVKMPRFGIASLMVFVAIAAVDFAAMRALLAFDSRAARLLLLGALPMANVVAVSLLIDRRLPGSRPFLRGFGAFSAIALALYVTFSFIPNEQALALYTELAFYLLANTVGSLPEFVGMPLEYVVGVVMFVWPQLAFALIGGFLSQLRSAMDRT
jgi:hypothetical protein